MDIFDKKGLSPMLLTEQKEPFDSNEYLYEMKFDGIRCLAYLDSSGTELRNKRSMTISSLVPELSELHKGIGAKCILDGELVVFTGGKPDFEEVQRRTLTSSPLKIKMHANMHPATFVAFDILYKDGKEITSIPLEERKHILSAVVPKHSTAMVVSFAYDEGVSLFNLTASQELEGIVAKRKASQYYWGKRSKDWIKIRNLIDEDFLACGYIKNENAISLVLAKGTDGHYQPEGRVTLGVPIEHVLSLPVSSRPLLDNPDDSIVWFKAPQECTVRHRMQQSIFRGFAE